MARKRNRAKRNRTYHSQSLVEYDDGNTNHYRSSRERRQWFQIFFLHRILPCGHVAREPDLAIIVPIDEPPLDPEVRRLELGDGREMTGNAGVIFIIVIIVAFVVLVFKFMSELNTTPYKN